MKIFNILDAQQFNRPSLKQIIKTADKMQVIVQNGGTQEFSDKKIICIFYEPSTRTHASFQAAIYYLGGQTIFSSENAGQFSSAAKGETIEDTIQTLCCYHPDAIIIRHPEIGSARRAAAVSSVPIINAGDGAGEHPTQSLLDLYTIYQKTGHIDDIKIAMVGDLLHGRTVRSLACLLANYKGVKLYFVSPKSLRMGNDIKNYLNKNKIDFEETDNLRKVASKVDVIYQTRIQKERFKNIKDYNKVKGVYVIDQKIVNVMPEKSIIIHPLPRVDEIDLKIDDNQKAYYFKQAENGLYVRMALLKLIFENNK